ncbi:MAG: hypothetical protein LBG87_02555 [Spirochaetaceae bacterium]|nr:hypothetical protein [Spirochaetaceae bacterium]
MKSVIRLILVMSLCFVVVFLIAGLVAFLQIRIDAIRSEPVLSGMQAEDLAGAGKSVLPLMIYFATLLGISYTARKGVPIPLSIGYLVCLGMVWTILVALGISVLEKIPAETVSRRNVALGGPGLIVTQTDRSLVFLQDPGNDGGPQVIAVPDMPLTYQPEGAEYTEERNQRISGLYPALKQSNMFFFLNGMLMDFDFAAQQMQNRLQTGFFFFILYAFALIFLLSSLRFIMDTSGWPMANLFLGILAFRGILALERLLDSAGVQQFLTSFIGDRFPDGLISPAAFFTLGIIIILGAALIHLGKNRRTPADEDF